MNVVFDSHRRTVNASLVGAMVLIATMAGAVETITMTDDKGATRELIGTTLIQASDGGRLFECDDGQLWKIQASQVVSADQNDQPDVPVDQQQISKRLLNEFPPGFKIHQTTHYVIIHNTNDAYVRWVGAMFEQLYKGYFIYWKNLGWDLQEPKYPLVAVVFADRAGFDEYGKYDVGDAALSTIGYYNLQTNRITTYNVPNAERQISTVIHEATHQLAYNTGLQRRYADNPMWVTEGMAIFFESPDFTSPRGWRSIGNVNPVNLDRFKRYLPRRGSESLATLLTDDMRFRNQASMSDAYSEAWALTYFLMRTKKKEYIKYLKTLSEGKPLEIRDKRQRIELFEQIMKTDLATIDRQFINYMRGK